MTPCVVPCVFSIFHLLESNVCDRHYTVITLWMLACVLWVLSWCGADFAGWVLVVPPALSSLAGSVYSRCIGMYLSES